MESVVIHYQNLHTRAASGWLRSTVEFRPGANVGYYLSQVPGLIGARTHRQLRVSRILNEKKIWVKVRQSHVLKEGESIALTPRSW